MRHDAHRPLRARADEKLSAESRRHQDCIGGIEQLLPVPGDSVRLPYGVANQTLAGLGENPPLLWNAMYNDRVVRD